MHPWHDINLGKKAPRQVQVVNEVPAGSRIKYELDKETGLIRVDRILYSAVHYPSNYGFIPQTYCEDGDPLDILVLSEESFAPLSLLEARPLGVLNMIDQGEADDKIIAVHAHDPEYQTYKSLEDLPAHLLLKIRRFFEDYKILENKQVIVESLEGQSTAYAKIETAVELYQSLKRQLWPSR